MKAPNAKTFLLENPTKKPIHAATVFGIFPQTLYSLIARDKKPGSEMKKSEHKGGNNKILEEHQEKAIHHFIRSLLAYNIQPNVYYGNFVHSIIPYQQIFPSTFKNLPHNHLIICYLYEMKAQYLKIYSGKYDKLKLQFPGSINNVPMRTHSSYNLFLFFLTRTSSNCTKRCFTVLFFFLLVFIDFLWVLHIDIDVGTAGIDFLERRSNKSNPKQINALHTLYCHCGIEKSLKWHKYMIH